MRIGLSRYTSDPPREKGFQRLSSLYITHYKLYAIQSLSNSLSLSLSLSIYLSLPNYTILCDVVPDLRGDLYRSGIWAR